MNYLYIKRITDIVFSIVILTLSIIPVFFILFLSVLIDKHFPFFIQLRSGIQGKKIRIYKIKSMKLDNNNQLYVTKLGRFIRFTKIDEIPQFINIILNDMSLVGPRPLFIEFNELYNSHHKKRLYVKPGLTGLAQVKVRDSTDWISKFEYDCHYVENISLSLDLYIFFKTITLLFTTILLKKNKISETIDYKENFMKNYVNK